MRLRLDLITFVRALASDRTRLALENAALRQQLNVLQRNAKRPRIHDSVRLFWVLLSRLFDEWKDHLILVKPETVVRWHRQGFRYHWRWKSRAKPGRPPIAMEVIQLIRRLSTENGLWGAPRIHSELALLGHDVAKSTVAKYMVKRTNGEPSQGWRTFLANHLKTAAAPVHARLNPAGRSRRTHPHMSFAKRLKECNPAPEGRSWIYVPYDQLTDRIGPLSRIEAGAAGIVLVEAPAKAARRPYHRQKLALILANQRHFALEQAARGVAVHYIVSDGSYAESLRDLGPLVAMRPAERELRVEIESLDNVTLAPHEGWLTTTEQFESACGDPPWRMDAFYRRVRRDTGLLMEDGKPEGGRFSFDGENRESWPGQPPAPAPPLFPPDPIKTEVGALIEREYSDHPGRVDLDAIPATAQDAAALWSWALAQCLPLFGPYEDAMSRTSRSLFHSRISPLLHLHRLLPADVVRDVAALDAPLASREGFVRQVLGWREFVRHVHESTDGFRRCESNVLDATTQLPDAYWGAKSGLACLDTVVNEVWEDGYSHHIPRLMVLANIATLLDVSPRELTDWFWVAFIDAFDWVVEPNVLGMGTFAVGDLMTTKPYVSGAAYINRMSDYCSACAFDPKRNCPITRLYWAFLGRHEERLAGNHRLRMILASLRKRPAARRAEDAATFSRVRDTLARGEVLLP